MGSIDIAYDIDVMRKILIEIRILIEIFMSLVPPKFTKENNGIFATEQSYKNGEHLRLPCSVEGKPIPIRRWFFNGKNAVDLPRIR